MILNPAYKALNINTDHIIITSNPRLRVHVTDFFISLMKTKFCRLKFHAYSHSVFNILHHYKHTLKHGISYLSSPEDYYFLFHAHGNLVQSWTWTGFGDFSGNAPVKSTTLQGNPDTWIQPQCVWVSESSWVPLYLQRSPTSRRVDVTRHTVVMTLLLVGEDRYVFELPVRCK